MSDVGGESAARELSGTHLASPLANRLNMHKEKEKREEARRRKEEGTERTKKEKNDSPLSSQAVKSHLSSNRRQTGSGGTNS